uniref:Uncharacterized protein n=1 Tax=Hyaloperonospora arabidopsidis (strain Emoy2) TaxID=559515 RepID=M4C3H3_HYAAE
MVLKLGIQRECTAGLTIAVGGAIAEAFDWVWTHQRKDRGAQIIELPFTASSAEPKLEAVTPTVTVSALECGAPATSAATASSGCKMSGWGQALSPSASSSAPSKFASDPKTDWGSNMRKWNEPEHKTETAPVRQKTTG